MITNIKNQRFNKNGTIDCIATIDNNYEVPFTASIDDTEAVGADIYNRILSGEFGEVLPYVQEVLPIQIPQVISMAQCREQLIILGLDDEVEAILASIPDQVKQKIYKSAWEYNTIVKIDNAMLLELAPMLSIDLDKFFIDASKL